MPDRDQVRQVEQALAWVIWALFVYCDEIGLSHPAFW